LPAERLAPDYACAPSGLQRLGERIDLLVGRETAQLLLGKSQLAVDRDLEYAATRSLIGDFGAGYLCEPRSRTESLWLIVSDHAVLDDDLHGSLVAPMEPSAMRG